MVARYQIRGFRQLLNDRQQAKHAVGVLRSKVADEKQSVVIRRVKERNIGFVELHVHVADDCEIWHQMLGLLSRFCFAFCRKHCESS